MGGPHADFVCHLCGAKGTRLGQHLKRFHKICTKEGVKEEYERAEKIYREHIEDMYKSKQVLVAELGGENLNLATVLEFLRKRGYQLRDDGTTTSTTITNTSAAAAAVHMTTALAAAVNTSTSTSVASATAAAGSDADAEESKKRDRKTYAGRGNVGNVRRAKKNLGLHNQFPSTDPILADFSSYLTGLKTIKDASNRV